jgi:hypothetical protein
VAEFGLVLMRCRPGVEFAPEDEPVRAVFAVATPLDEREFYLTALVAIAEITGRADFDEAWLGARSTEALREVVLSAERRREPADGSGAQQG